MRFLKARGLAVALGSAAFLIPADVAAQSRVVPEQRLFEALNIGTSGRIGVRISDVEPRDLTARKLASQSGVVIQDVEEGTPAARAGLKEGDVILEFDGERVRSARQFTRLVQETPAGRQVALVISRDGQRMNLSVQPERSEPPVEFVEPRVRMEPAPAPRSRDTLRIMPRIDRLPEVFGLGAGRLGIGTETLTAQLAKHFGVERGVLVTEVMEDSAASKAGLRAGDVITKVNGTSIDDTMDLLRAIGDNSGEVSIEIVRDRKTQTLKASIEASRTRTYRRVI